ncbi:hypothetical protein BCR34DRAFT_551599 [Clohesyomyces aquaticus]|uniref:UBC core domain-containing protein n=1 Tax=Clohesyomyces aquaticus TaxID=1231657 RepID=A0A1Y2AB69_9PLEO|nr:hypothetical protein BCR34DRAFT_551599 [Clohesyomyces aquaticus]
MDRPGRSNPCWEPNDEEGDSLRLAFQLHEELNGKEVNSAPMSSSNRAGYDGDLALAIHLSSEWNKDTTEPDPMSLDHGDGMLISYTTGLALRGGANLKVGQEIGKNKTSHSAAASSSSSTTFKTYSEFATHMRARSCPRCHTKYITGPGDIEKLLKGWLNGQGAITSLLKCTRCLAKTCIGCVSKSSGKNPASHVNVQGMKVSWCCSAGRLFLLWVILCGFDQQFCSEKQREAAKTGTGRSHRPYGDTGVGYGGGIGDDLNSLLQMYSVSPYGMEHGHGRFGPPNVKPDASKEKAQNAQQVSDSFTGMVLTLLGELLPSLDRQSSFDMGPPEAIPSMLLNSKILNKAAELLRNDSLEDATKRKELYQALLTFLRAIGTHPATAKQTLFSERVLRPDTVSLLPLSFGSNTGKDKEDTSSSLEDCLRNLNTQSNMMLRGAQLNPQEFYNQEGQDMLWLCRQVSDLSGYLFSTTKCGSGGRKSKVQADTDHGIVEVDDSLIFSNHHFAYKARYMKQSPPGRMKRLITEITTLKTGLPPGIFVKYATSRLDVMKFIIVGPRGTPYENGLFEFDLFCTPNFPYESPKVKFRTTGNGTVNFNPNLYADGHVCLSLLGTWDGEPWRPAQSTILQVLVSIQAMILCEQPLCNEPENERDRNSPKSVEYNREVQGYTVRFATMNWLQGPGPVWKDVVDLHFKKNAQAILQTVSNWERDAGPTHRANFGMPMGPGRGSARPESISSLKPQLEKLLSKYGAKPVPANAGQATSSQNLAQGFGGNRGPPGFPGPPFAPRGGFGGGYGGGYGGRHGGGFGAGRGGFGGRGSPFY